MYEIGTWKFTWWNPLSEIKPLILFLGMHDTCLRVHPGKHPAHMSLHCIIVLLKNSEVTIMVVELPWKDLHCSSPAYTTTAARLPWSGIRNISAWNLCTSDVAKPFVIELLCSKVMHHGNTYDLSITGIGSSLSMWTVTCNRSVHIVDLTLLPDLINLVDKVIRSLELT